MPPSTTQSPWIPFAVGVLTSLVVQRLYERVSATSDGKKSRANGTRLVSREHWNA